MLSTAHGGLKRCGDPAMVDYRFTFYRPWRPETADKPDQQAQHGNLSTAHGGLKQLLRVILDSEDANFLPPMAA